MSSCAECFIFDFTNISCLSWSPARRVFLRSEVCLLPLNIACIRASYQNLLTDHLEQIMVIIIFSIICIITTIVISIVIIIAVVSSYYCYYYRFQINILPLGPFPRGSNISWYPHQLEQTDNIIHWVDRAKTCDFKSAVVHQRLGWEMLHLRPEF